MKQIEALKFGYMLLTTRTEKTEYAMKLVRKLRKEGIRFLKKDNNDGKTWSDVGDIKMREKVSQNLREHQPKVKLLAAEQQKKTIEGATIWSNFPVYGQRTIQPTNTATIPVPQPASTPI